MRPHHLPAEVVSFLGHNYPAHTWDMGLSILAMVALLALYYSFHWSLSDE